MNKETLRRKLKEKRATLSKDYVEKNSNTIAKKCISYIKNKQIDALVGYSAFQNEIDLTLLYEWALQKNIALFFPKYDHNNYICSQVSDLNELKTGKYNIKEPLLINGSLNNYKHIYWFIPGLAFDKENNRLGFGKGVYDQLLTNNKDIKIGIGYNFQHVKKIDTAKHDIKMNLLIIN